MLNQLLQSLGHNPTNQTQSRTTYKSPFNPQEKTPSFCVFPNRAGEWNNFKDYSTGAGGDAYKFIMSYFCIGFKEAKEKIAELTGAETTKSTCTYQNQKEQPNHPNQNNQPSADAGNSFSFNQQNKESYEIIKTQELQNKALIDYLTKDRGITSIDFKRHLKEVYYRINEKSYFALSFENDSGGREVRNKYFKGSFGKKDITFISPMPLGTQVKIFEGFIDYLSYLDITKNAHISDYIILNSVSLLDKALELIQGKYELIELYFDNDKAGNEATEKIIKNISRGRVIDKRKKYQEYKDLNEYLKSL